jgi:hypothetical protein
LLLSGYALITVQRFDRQPWIYLFVGFSAATHLFKRDCVDKRQQSRRK